MADDTEPNGKGRKLIAEWQSARDRLRHLELQITDARNGVSDASRALASWLAPKDAKPGESFGIWERDKHGNEMLFSVKFSSVSDPEIEVRRR